MVFEKVKKFVTLNFFRAKITFDGKSAFYLFFIESDFCSKKFKVTNFSTFAKTIKNVFNVIVATLGPFHNFSQNFLMFFGQTLDRSENDHFLAFWLTIFVYKTISRDFDNFQIVIFQSVEKICRCYFSKLFTYIVLLLGRVSYNLLQATQQRLIISTTKKHNEHTTHIHTNAPATHTLHTQIHYIREREREK